MKILTLGFLLFLLSACASPTPVGTGLVEFQDCKGVAAILVVDSQGHWELLAPDGSKAFGNPNLPPDVVFNYAKKMASTVPDNAKHGVTIGECPRL